MMLLYRSTDEVKLVAHPVGRATCQVIYHLSTKGVSVRTDSKHTRCDSGHARGARCMPCGGKMEWALVPDATCLRRSPPDGGIRTWTLCDLMEKKFGRG